MAVKGMLLRSVETVHCCTWGHLATVHNVRLTPAEPTSHPHTPNTAHNNNQSNFVGGKNFHRKQLFSSCQKSPLSV